MLEVIKWVRDSGQLERALENDWSWRFGEVQSGGEPRVGKSNSGVRVSADSRLSRVFIRISSV